MENLQAVKIYFINAYYGMGLIIRLITNTVVLNAVPVYRNQFMFLLLMRFLLKFTLQYVVDCAGCWRYESQHGTCSPTR